MSSSNTDSHKTSVAGISPCGKISFILRYLSERSVAFIFDYECIYTFLVRYQFMIHITKRTSLYGLKTVQYIASKLWNTLTLFIRIASSMSTFRSKLKAYFIDSYA